MAARISKHTMTQARNAHNTQANTQLSITVTTTR